MPELLTRGDGLLKPAEVTGFKSEWWPTSNRNAVRLRVVTPGRNKSEFAPSFDFLANAYFPALRHMGFCFDALLKRWGWYPAGGGELGCRIAPRAAAFCGRALPA